MLIHEKGCTTDIDDEKLILKYEAAVEYLSLTPNAKQLCLAKGSVSCFVAVALTPARFASLQTQWEIRAIRLQ